MRASALPPAARRLGLACLLGAGLAGCARTAVTIPSADGTPPVSALDVVTSGERLVMLGGDAPRILELTPGDSAILIALGMDKDGGVKEVSLSGNAVATCRSGDKDTVKSGSFARRLVLPGQPGDKAPGQRVARLVLRPDDFRKICGPLEIRSVAGAVGVRTVNFHGVSSASPTLEFKVAGPFPAAATVASPAARTAQGPQVPQKAAPVYGPLPLSEYPDTPRI